MADDEIGPVLVPLDGSLPTEQPLQTAQVISDLEGSEIAVVFVSPETLSPEGVSEALRIPDEWRSRVRLLSAKGEPAAAIRRVAADIGSHLIIMSTHGSTGNLESVAGHVTLQVLHDPPCPVLVLRSALDFFAQAQRLRHLRRILLPLDGTPEAVLIVREAALAAQRAGARLLMLHVVDARAETGRAPASPTYVDQQSHGLEAWREEFLRSSFALAETPPGGEIDVVLRVGEPGAEIARFAAESDCDLIATAWSGNLSPGRAIVVQTLLQCSPCPLMFLLAREELNPRIAR